MYIMLIMNNDMYLLNVHSWYDSFNVVTIIVVARHCSINVHNHDK